MGWPVSAKDFNRTPKPNPFWYEVVLTVAKIAFWLLGGLEVHGRENIPKAGPVIIAPNHTSHADPPAAACASRRPFFFLAKEELFVGLFGKLIFSIGAFPVSRGTGDTEAVRRSIAILEAGGALVVFPEGSRGDGSKLGPLNKGVALLAKKTGAQVVPVYIAGTSRLLTKGRALPQRSRVKVYFGKPFRMEDTAIEGGKPTSAGFARHLAEEIVELGRQSGAELTHSESEAEAAAPKTGSDTPPSASSPTPA